MQYEIPDEIPLVIGSNDTQIGFFYKILMEAAFKAGLPLLERADYANFILRLPMNLKEAEKLLDIRMQETPSAFKILWNGKDPSPKDKTLEIQDWEFKKLRGKNFTIVLNDFEKGELKRRQTYYVLNGGVLGSEKEIPRETDTIIVDLNFVYEKAQFNEAKAQAAFQKQITFAEKVYGVIGIKFYSTWTAGAGNWETRTIKEGKKDSFVNIFLSVRSQKDAISLVNATIDEKTGEVITKDIFLIKGQFESGGLVENSLNENALAHELGHKFGLFGDADDRIFGFKSLFGYSARNWVSDIEIDSALKMLNRGAVRKGYDWNKLGKGNRVIVSSMRDFWASISTYDKMRIGARRLSKAQ